MNIQVVQNNLGDMKEIGKKDQQSNEDAKKKVMEQPAVEKINTALAQIRAQQEAETNAVSNWLAGNSNTFAQQSAQMAPMMAPPAPQQQFAQTQMQ